MAEDKAIYPIEAWRHVDGADKAMTATQGNREKQGWLQFDKTQLGSEHVAADLWLSHFRFATNIQGTPFAK